MGELINDMISESLGNEVNKPAIEVSKEINEEDINTAVAEEIAGELLEEPIISEDEDLIGADIDIDHSVYIEGYESEEEIAHNKKVSKIIWILTIVIAILTAFAIKTIFISAIYVPSESMDPTVKKGEIVIGDSIDVMDRNIQRGDIIMFRYPKQVFKNYIKRVIGLPGDRVIIVQNRIYINDSVYPLEEPYVKEGTWTTSTNLDTKDIKTYDVPKGEYFVLGDNRENSEDSRYWGFVPASYIKAKGKYVIHSLIPFNVERLNKN